MIRPRHQALFLQAFKLPHSDLLPLTVSLPQVRHTSKQECSCASQCKLFLEQGRFPHAWLSVHLEGDIEMEDDLQRKALGSPWKDITQESPWHTRLGLLTLKGHQ